MKSKTFSREFRINADFQEINVILTSSWWTEFHSSPRLNIHTFFFLINKEKLYHLSNFLPHSPPSTSDTFLSETVAKKALQRAHLSYSLVRLVHYQCSLRGETPSVSMQRPLLADSLNTAANKIPEYYQDPQCKDKKKKNTKIFLKLEI